MFTLWRVRQFSMTAKTMHPCCAGTVLLVAILIECTLAWIASGIGKSSCLAIQGLEVLSVAKTDHVTDDVCPPDVTDDVTKARPISCHSSYSPTSLVELTREVVETKVKAKIVKKGKLKGSKGQRKREKRKKRSKKKKGKKGQHPGKYT